MMKKLFKLAAVAITGVVLGLLIQSCSTAKPIDNAQLEGYWVLKTFESKPVGESFKGSIPSLEFDFEKGQIYGSAGCNRYFGGFTFENNVLKAPNLGSTMMACIEENKENEFLKILSLADGLQVSIENDLLIFKNGDTAVLEFSKGEKQENTTQASVEE